MSSYSFTATTDTIQTPRRYPPELTFPPKYVSTQSNSQVSRLQPTLKKPPNLTFPSMTNNSIPSSVPSPPRTSPTLQTSPQLSTITTSSNSNTMDISPLITAIPPPLLSLPLEIRLQIYNYVLQSHPIFHPHLAPPPSSLSKNTTEILESHTTFFRPLGQSLPSSSLLTSTTLTSTLIPSSKQPISTLSPTSEPSMGGGEYASSLSSTTSASTSASYFSDSDYNKNSTSNQANHPRQLGHTTRGKIPTSLLLTCHQLFNETHLLPFQQNTFSFINWFWSGLYASRQFTRSLRPWQVSSLRYVGVEVLTRDLMSAIPVIEEAASPDEFLTSEEIKRGMSSEEGSGSGNDISRRRKTEWEDLCLLWTNVWSLRLGIKGSIQKSSSSLKSSRRRRAQEIEFDISSEERIFTYPELLSIPEFALQEEEEKVLCVLDAGADWVVKGLLEMKGLRWIQVEIEDEEVNREDKIGFCAQLEGVLNGEGRKRDGWDGPTRVILVEKQRVVEEVEKSDVK